MSLTAFWDQEKPWPTNSQGCFGVAVTDRRCAKKTPKTIYSSCSESWHPLRQVLTVDWVDCAEGVVAIFVDRAHAARDANETVGWQEGLHSAVILERKVGNHENNNSCDK